MYIANYRESINNYISIQLIHKPDINMHIYWLNPLLFKRKDL